MPDPIDGEQARASVDDIGSARGDMGSAHTERPRQEGDPASARGRFLCRIQEGKWFGGVCVGIAAYGHFRVDWVRTVILLLALLTGGVLVFIYLVLLLALPVVPTVAEYERRRDGPLGTTT